MDDELTDYQKETLDLIRTADSRFDGISNQVICRTWREYSDLNWSAGWVGASEEVIKGFILWALKTPIERHTHA